MLISTLSRRFASSATVTPTAQKWDIFASVILSRPPIIAPKMSEIEERFQKLQKQEEEEKSLLCNYELKTKQDLKMVARREQLLREGKELSELDEEIGVTNAQKEDDWSKAAADLDQKFKFGANVLAENAAENLKSVDRALERKLVLIVKQKMGGGAEYSSPWILPQMKHREGETLRQTAERCIGELSGSADLSVDISGNAPFGVFTHRYPKPIAQKTGASGAKIFFYTANLAPSTTTTSSSSESFSVNPEDVSDFQWVTREEFWTICAFCRKKMSEFSIKRPTASETDDDLQQMQEEWSKIAQKPSVEDRGAKKAENPPGHAPKISKFKAQRLKKGAEPIQKGAELPQTTTGKGAELPHTADDRDKPLEKGAEPEGAEPITKNVEEMMNELEVLDEWAGQEDQEKYNRLATDAIQLDLTAKFSRNLAQRQQRNAVKLFDNCKFKLDAEGPSDALLELARSQIDEIKRLYLEEHSDGHQVIYEFGKGVNPILDQCWSLIPIRRVLDTVERRQGHVSQDDVEICRLSILWTYMLWAERRSAFFAFAEPNDFYIHLAELFLIGPEILADDVIKKATRKLLEDYVLVQAIAGKINIRMSQKLAGLDAFMPFYEQLIKCYEQYSMGDNDFTMAILIGAYLNAPVGER
ncbi:hypothetical protein L3Y34_005492 [Caenorhabditis briggsae]|uniref:39S ribosomal protein L46, mitochondrial n=1 Tax=Caenorhabditis briggsae TaxID=6238 RepID=A0AAE9AES3_CAEBR|nr:hypothetical protein L3Y34_005492 [Caenorhabditis briggsae]